MNLSFTIIEYFTYNWMKIEDMKIALITDLILIQILRFCKYFTHYKLKVINIKEISHYKMVSDGFV